MGRDYSKVDAAFGFQPYGNVLRSNLYAVQTEPDIGVYHNDIVVHGGTGLSTLMGYLPIIEDGSVPDSDDHILGSVLEIFDEDMMPVAYIAASEAGNAVIAGYVTIADHPNQLFIAQEDGVGAAIDADDMGENCDLIAVADCAGNTDTGISTMELDSSDATTDATGQFKIIRPHEDDTIDVDATPNNRWVVAVNEHFFHDVVGAGA